MDVLIRNALEKDLSSINSIYNYYVECSTCTFQIKAETIEDRKKWFIDHKEGYPVIVAELDNEIIGWASLSGFHKREAYKPTVENSVYVKADKTGIGIGSLLLEELIKRARSYNYHSIIAGISADQKASINLHKKFKFKKAALLREVGNKFNKFLDVAYYQLML